MSDFFRALAAWFVIWAVFIVAVAATLATLGILIIAVPALALMRRAFTLKRAPRQAGSGRVLEGEYRIVDETEPEGPAPRGPRP